MFKYYLNIVFNMSAILLHHGVKTTTPLADMLLSKNDWLSFSHALTTAHLLFLEKL